MKDKRYTAYGQYWNNDLDPSLANSNWEQSSREDSLQANDPVVYSPDEIEYASDGSEWEHILELHEAPSFLDRRDNTQAAVRTMSSSGILQDGPTTIVPVSLQKENLAVTIAATEEHVVPGDLELYSREYPDHYYVPERLPDVVGCRPGPTDDGHFIDGPLNKKLQINRARSRASLYNLMQIRSDKQDLSFVEKVVLPQDEISAFCNDLVPYSVKPRHDGRELLNFGTLNTCSLHFLGFYGCKTLMAEMFVRDSVIDDATAGLMQEEKLQPGLYASVRNDTVCIFYWHEGPKLLDASRKDISCNFIRYLVELCDTVHICLDSVGLEASLSVPASTSSKKKRTQRLKVSVVKASENDVKLSSGFEITLSGKQHLSTPVETFPYSSTEQSGVIGFKLSEGLHRLALLVATVRPPKKQLQNTQTSLKVKDMPNVIKGWESHYNLDVSGLNDKELLVFLQCAELNGYQEFCSFKHGLEQRKKEQSKKVYEVDSLVSVQQELALSIFLRGAFAFLRLNYPWEEALLSSSTMDSVEIASRTKPTVEGTNKSPPNKLTEAASTLRGSTPSIAADFAVPVDLSHHHAETSTGLQSEIKMWQQSKQADFDCLEREISEIWTGKQVSPFVREFLFPDSQVNFSLKGAVNLLKLENTVDFIVEVNGGNSKNLGPIMYGQEIFLHFKDSHGQFLASRFLPIPGKCVAGPVLISQPLRLQVTVTQTIFSSRVQVHELMGINVIKDPLSDPMQTWIGSYAKVVPSGLREVAAVANFALNRFGEEHFGLHAGLNTEQQVSIIQRMLHFKYNSFKSLQQVDLTLLQDQLAHIRETEFNPKDESAVLDVHPAVRTTCLRVYKRGRSEFQSRVSGMVKNTFSPLFKAKVEADIKLESLSLEEHVKKEECAHILNLRKTVATRVPDLPTLFVKSCSLHETYEREKTATVSYAKQVLEKENMTWNAIELAPLKKDLDSLSSTSSHSATIIPTCSVPMKLIDLDTTQERLSKVSYLKSGEVLVLVQQIVGEALHKLYLSPRFGVDLSTANPIRVFKRGTDRLAFDETCKLIALYDRSLATVKIGRFGERFTTVDWTGVEVALNDWGINSVTWMEFVPGKRELVIIDDAQCVRLFEMSPSAMMRPRNIKLNPFFKACISVDGACLIVFHKITKHYEVADEPLPSEEVSVEIPSLDSTAGAIIRDSNNEAGNLAVEVYMLDETMSHMKSVELDVLITDTERLVATVVCFGPQMHLVIHDSTKPEVICSRLLEISSASEVCELKVLNNKYQKVEEVASSSERLCIELEYIYYIFDKYSVSPPLQSSLSETGCTRRQLSFELLWKAGQVQMNLSAQTVHYVSSRMEKLKQERGKDFSGLEIIFNSQSLESFRLLPGTSRQMQVGSFSSSSHTAVKAGDWVQRLVCLVPIQIARAENNGLKPLVDGLQIPANLNYADALSLANVIRFGFYDSVLESWVGSIKVVSSMGKQSSGKSYLLNHLSGSLLDVAGGRCTDGVWMTMRTTNDCMYILLDFEGLGSFERSEQEDMLLSILNAAVSNITIFNKKDFHLDKETEAVFERFQNGVSLVKEDEKLFKGLFYMAVKDVDAADVEDLKREFQDKISLICSKSQDNFLTKMYGGEVDIAAMAPFNRPEFYESIIDIARTVEELDTCNHNGQGFSRDLKLVIAQISAKDWSPIDSKRVAFKVNLLKKHLSSAVTFGRSRVANTKMPLLNFDTDENINESGHMQVDGYDFDMVDTNIQLAPHESQVIGTILDPLGKAFQREVPRKGENDEAWHSSFQNFLAALADRRKHRVLEWLEVNTTDFSNDGDVQKLKLEALAMLAELPHKLSLCSCKCQRCFLRCILERYHPGDHSCKGSHMCTKNCSYCLDDSKAAITGDHLSRCSDSAGHEGSHDCQQKSHTCGEVCSLQGQSSNCNKACILKPRHSGDHKCNSRQHMCKMECSLPTCRNTCVSPVELGNHSLHACHEKLCPEKCTMKGCNRKCASEDHFHAKKPGVVHHYCGSEHPCYQQCEAPGVCEVLTEVVRKTSTFQGKRANFEYEHVSEQNGVRKDCCIAIPPFQEQHQGPHSHTTNTNAVHFCEISCEACGYFCNLPINHNGLHNTTHGNMRDVSFVSEVEDFDILDRKYTWGESGMAEMCMMHCKAQGRGHIHLIPCPEHNHGGACFGKLVEGSRHEIRKYGPNFDAPKDELTHAAFWKQMRFKDPCSDDEQRQFSLCNHHCPSDEHIMIDSSSGSSQQISYCTESLWHAAVPRTTSQTSGVAGYVTEDGHRFCCNHSKNVANHVIFVIDRSGSMGDKDCKPSMVKFSQPRTNNRLGCVYEAILRFIRTRLSSSSLQDLVSVVLFSCTALVVIEGQEMKENLVDLLLCYNCDGGTNYSAGMRNAERILSNRSNLDATSQTKSPVIIFLSDGGNNGGEDPVFVVRAMKQVEPKLILHTIKFGSDPYNQILMDMAKAGDGTFQVSLDEVELAKSFECLAKSCRPKVASLM